MTWCSTSHDQAATPAPGTAPRAGFWIALEQNGVWGPKAAVESHLDPELGRQLTDACSVRGGTFILVRRPTGHADVSTPGRQLFVAYAGPSPWLLRATLPEGGLPDLLARLDLVPVAAGDETRVRDAMPELCPVGPVLLVCTNGRRDQCCAIKGRRVALDATEILADRPAADPTRPVDDDRIAVWESSHLGGHRFAATGLVLPVGRAMGRLDAALAADLVVEAEAGRMPRAVLNSRHDRGATRLPPPAQVAEHAVRVTCGDTAYLGWDAEVTTPGAWSQHPTPGEVAHVSVRHTDGRAWTVQLSWQPREPLPESCGKGAVDTGSWSVDAITLVERPVG